MCTCSSDPVAAVLIAVNQNVAKVIVQTELKQAVTGACDCPAVSGVVVNIQTMRHCTIPETPVVVCIATAAILYAIDVVIIVYHFMQQGGGNVFNGSCQCSSSNIDFMTCAVLGNPCIIPEGEMSVGFGGGLDGDVRP